VNPRRGRRDFGFAWNYHSIANPTANRANRGALGYRILAPFVASWGYPIYRFKRYDLNPGLGRF
jgi:hypothetical protein